MDIDIDLQTTFDPNTVFPTAVRASMVKDEKIKKHPAGMYLQNVPQDCVTSLSAIPYDKAEKFGFIKFDMLHLSLLDNFESKKEIDTLLKLEPDWSLLLHKDVVEQLFQLRNHYDLVVKLQPNSVEKLADCIALIRPAKRYLVESYVKDPKNTQKWLYEPPTDGQYYFKRGHAISYALNIVLQLHLLK